MHGIGLWCLAGDHSGHLDPHLRTQTCFYKKKLLSERRHAGAKDREPQPTPRQSEVGARAALPGWRGTLRAVHT